MLRRSTLRAAIKTEVLAKNRRDKRYSHRRRLNRVAEQQTLSVLSKQAGAIGKVRSFDGLCALVDSVLEPSTRFGELHASKACVRLGAKLNLIPSAV
jgi:hypothetical protein